MIGKTISHYKILEKIGEGGMGKVYKAEDTKLKRIVALKFLSPQLLPTDEDKKRFLREAQAGAALEHPNICRVYEVGEVNGLNFIAMAYLDGQTLKDKIKSGQLALDEALCIAMQIADALNEAHSKGIIHRDVKSSNVMITTKGLAVLTDFGLALNLESSSITKDGTTLGTFAYMSPEQLKGIKADHRTDIWSFGVMLYEIVTGELPFKGDSPQAVIYSILHEEPEPLSLLRAEVPFQLEQIVGKAIAKEPGERYREVNEIKDDLTSLKAHLETGTLNELKLSASSVKRITALRGKDLLKRALVDLANKTVMLKLEEAISQNIKYAVGRKQELYKLHDYFKSVGDGKGQLLCVTGEAGLGKTTLTNMFFKKIAESGQPCIIAKGRSFERLAGSEGYLPILEALTGLVKSNIGDPIRQLMKLVAPTWYVQVVPVSDDDFSDAKIRDEAKVTSQERMKREFAALLWEMSQIRPLILFLDDLHWADVSTIDLLSYIGNQLEKMSLLLLVGYRPTELLLSQNKFDQVKLNLQARQLCSEISLEFLGREDIEDYLEIAFPDHKFPAEFIELSHKKTEGSPLFMVDLLSHLHENGVIVRDNSHWIITQSISEIRNELPESTRSMVQRKITQISEVDQRILIAASVQGHEFDSVVVSKVLEIEAEQIEDRLQFLDRVHSLVQLKSEQEFPDMTPTLSYEFVHNLYQNAFYDTLTLTRKSKLSMSVAETLLNFYGEKSNEIAAELAYLFETGRDFAKASDYFSLAAQNATRIFANQEAIMLYQRAVANAEKLMGSERNFRIVTAALQLSRIHFTSYAFQATLADFELAEKAAQEDNNAIGQIYALCGKASMFFMAKQLEATQNHGRRALEIAKESKSEIGMASALAAMATERLGLGDIDKAEEYYDKAIPVLRQHGSPSEALEPTAFRGFLAAWQIDYEKVHELCNWTITQAQQGGFLLPILSSKFILTMALGNEGRISEAMRTIQEGEKLVELHGLPHGKERSTNTLGWLHYELQDIEKAIQLNTESVKFAQNIKDMEAEVNARVNLCQNYLMVGEYERALEHLQESQKLYDQDVWFRWRYNIRIQVGFANYWIVRGDLKLAREYAITALNEAERTLSRKYIAWCNKLLGDITLLEDRIEDAQNHFNSAVALLSNYPCPTIEWRILNSAIALAKKIGDDHKRDELIARKRVVIQSLADSVDDEKLRNIFLSSKAVREP